MELEAFYPMRLTTYDLEWIMVNSLDNAVVLAARNASLMAKSLDWFLPCDANDLIVGMMLRDFENRKRI